jgi:ABC-type phosphate transport system substrate-binding protein
MKRLSARRVLTVCAISAASVAALVAPGAASAATGEACSGSNIFSAGSSLQALAQQEVWAPGFNSTKSKSLFACNGKQGAKKLPTITYESVGSGAGYKKWKEKDEYGKYGFIGTDNTVNQSEIEAVDAERDAGKESKLMTIPVLQGSVAVVVHLPAGCTSASSTVTGATGRLVFNDVTLEEIYAGVLTKWNEISAAENGGDALTCAEPADEEATIIPVVRKDSSGTTHIFKRYLGLISTATFEMENIKEKTTEKLTWGQASEGAQSTAWPKAAHVLTPAQETGPGLLEAVYNTAGSVGYANLADARETEVEAKYKYNFIPPTGGEGTPTFWVELENSSKTSKGKVTRKYADPASNKDVAAKAEANCKDTVFQNGTKVFPPPKLTEPWNEVTTELTSKTYSLCGLTYDLALTNYEAYESHGGSNAEATTVQNYLNYVLDAKGGQAAIKKHDYLGLPKELLTEALKGPAAIEG